MLLCYGYPHYGYGHDHFGYHPYGAYGPTLEEVKKIREVLPACSLSHNPSLRTCQRTPCVWSL